MDFTIVTPSHRQLDWLACCIASVADQKGVRVEHIVQDAGTEGFADFAEKMRQRWPDRVGYRRVMISEPDSGMYDAINKGLKQGSGRICAYLNCDEQYLPGALGKVKEGFDRNPQAEILYGGFLVVNEQGEPVTVQRPVRMFWQHVATSHLPNFTCATFFQRSMLERDRAWFDSSYRACGDAVWTLNRLRAGTPARLIPDFTSLFVERVTSQGLSPIGIREAEQIREATPRWTQWGTPLWKTIHRAKKLGGGRYRKACLSLEFFWPGQTERRKLPKTRVSAFWSARWPGAASRASRKALCVFAQAPPPLHGQSYMVAVLLECLQSWAREDPQARQVFHVDARLSRDHADIGRLRPGKILPLIGRVIRAVWVRLVGGCREIYYIPAPAKKSAILRDLLTVSLLKVFYADWILHWHSIGLGAWVRGDQAVFGGTLDQVLRIWMQRLYQNSRKSIILKQRFAEEAAVFHPREIIVLPNGIPDPCPNFDTDILPKRIQRYGALALAMAEKQPAELRLLHVGLCAREKGIFLGLEFARALAKEYPFLRLRLTFAGPFDSKKTRKELMASAEGLPVSFPGPVSGAVKDALFQEADALFFFSLLPETQGLVVLESLAWGLLPLLHQQQGIETVLEGTGIETVNPANPHPEFQRLFLQAAPQVWRRCYLDKFSSKRFCEGVRKIFAGGKFPGPSTGGDSRLG